MNIVSLPVEILRRNARIRMRRPMAVSPETGLYTLAGTLHSGYNEVTAEVAKGAQGRITLTFQLEFPSVPAAGFDLFRRNLKPILGGHPSETSIARAAGIPPSPPPQASTRMADYAALLFSHVVFEGAAVTDSNNSFPAPSSTDDRAYGMLTEVRSLDVKAIQLNGTLEVDTDAGAREASVYVPVTSVAFDDGLTVPFAGYSDTALLGLAQGTRAISLPRSLWRGD
jgi:hypothetical protein